jgi:hypothetical protein
MHQNAAMLALWMLALWPTHIFFGSQNLKEAPTLFTSSASLFFGLNALRAHISDKKAFSLNTAAATTLLLATGMYRAYLMIILAGTLLLGLFIYLFKHRSKKQGWLKPLTLAIAFMAPILLFKPVTYVLFEHILLQPPANRTDPSTRVRLIPSSSPPESPRENIKPFSPRGITRFRHIRHSQDQMWASRFSGRKIQTQIFPDEKFDTWFDVAAYLPKGMLYAMFMPLPGLYPSDGRLGRLFAMGENTLLLIIMILALAHWRHTPIISPEPIALAAFFVVMAACYGIFEFDLGAATRHRLQYFPPIFLFAAAYCARQLKLQDT